MEDWQLLQEFARSRSEDAFRELVARHAGMVLASATRQVNDGQLAQDITQAVFLLLARKAERMRPGKYRFTTVFKDASVTRHITIGGEQPPEMDLGEILLR